MLLYEYKLSGSRQQDAAIDEAIRIVQFIRNKSLRLWMETRGTSKNDLQCYCAVLAKEYPFASRLNSQARQASADRAWFAISRFYDNCKNKKPGKKGYPTFQRNNRSVEYKTSGWKLDPDGRHIIFTDGCRIGRLKLVGNKKQSIETFPVKEIKRVRIVRRADGYYVQFCVKTERKVEHVPTGKQLGIDVGLTSYLTDSEGNTVENPRHYRKAEKKLKRLQRKLSRKQKKSANRKKARKALARQHLKVQRQREDFARKMANASVSSSDLIAYEDLQIKNMVKNRTLAKSIHDAGWGTFIRWLNSYGALHDIPVVAVPPQYTSQKCSECGTIVKKSLSVRTHVCTGCGIVLDRDHNAALNILHIALQYVSNGTVGHTGTRELDSRNASGDLTSAASSKRRRGKSGR
ncbi:RNA-guided endonuclease InsQ/TnpB family protein [Thermosporothrix hazakensis]|uniref:RNA-guided endonuclease InsQ/TnpB family protein n=1 Tax=Thermosporothrix hazakensis TaxID=644383 RepID=UPI0010D2AF62|nr:RNA-guided endonuclease TnpB family protein [Thermosporothrix hazakensis]GCE50606.1 transposase [Thermosporothrix hazakensis]